MSGAAIGSFAGVAKWYGQVIGLVDATVELPPGVTGLLGPNGAGKSTFLKLLTGQLVPSQGEVRLLGVDPFKTPGIHGKVGFCPEPDAFYEDMCGYDFVHLPDPAARVLRRGRGDGSAPTRPSSSVGLAGRRRTARIRTYSKGMRQRIKLAQAIAHEPEVLVLDEPLTGMDPVMRRRTHRPASAEMGEAGTTVIVSSHVLHEVELTSPAM